MSIAYWDLYDSDNRKGPLVSNLPCLACLNHYYYNNNKSYHSKNLLVVIHEKGNEKRHDMALEYYEILKTIPMLKGIEKYITKEGHYFIPKGEARPYSKLMWYFSSYRYFDEQKSIVELIYRYVNSPDFDPSDPLHYDAAFITAHYWYPNGDGVYNDCPGHTCMPYNYRAGVYQKIQEFRDRGYNVSGYVSNLLSDAPSNGAPKPASKNSTPFNRVLEDMI